MRRLSDRQLYERSIRESDVVGEITNMLEVNGARVWPIIERIPWGRKTSTPGLPDLTGWFVLPTRQHPGLLFPLHFWIEVKRPGGKLRPSQERWIKDAQDDHVIAFKAASWLDCLSEFHYRGIYLKVE
jgi:hypothetical protein